MAAWLDENGRLFNPNPVLSVVPLAAGQNCYVLDDVLARPDALAAWAAHQAFADPVGYPYPGQVLTAPNTLAQRVSDHFALHVRSLLGARRTLDLTVRLSMVTLPPQALDPRQWQCHRDRVTSEPGRILFAASVLYLFREPAMGGTSFYMPRQSAQATDQMLEDSQLLSAAEFGDRYGLHAGYMAGGNAWFDRIAQVPAAWNRAIFYDGGLFHSADVEQPDLLSSDPLRGRLTLNSFFTCKLKAA
jgi:hypothetical protein